MCLRETVAVQPSKMTGNRRSGETKSVDSSSTKLLLSSVSVGALVFVFFLLALMMLTGDCSFLYKWVMTPQRAFLWLPGAGGLICVTVHCG